jgi:hypothetical protein
MKDRFNLEDEINQLYTFADQLGNISEGVLEQDLSTDEIANAIEGLRVIMKLQTQKLHDTMSQCFKLDQYRSSTYIPAEFPG